MQGVDDIAQRLGHLATMSITHHGVQVHLLEGHFAYITCRSWFYNLGFLSHIAVAVIADIYVTQNATSRRLCKVMTTASVCESGDPSNFVIVLEAVQVLKIYKMTLAL